MKFRSNQKLDNLLKEQDRLRREINYLRPVTDLNKHIAKLENVKQQIMSLNDIKKTTVIEAINEHANGVENDKSISKSKNYFTEIENFKQQIKNTIDLQTTTMMDFIDEHMNLMEIDYVLYNDYQHLKQVTKVLELELLKFDYLLEELDVFIKNNKLSLSQHVSEYTQLITNLQHEISCIQDARSYQEAAYQRVYPDHEIITEEIISKINQLEQALKSSDHKELLLDMHILAKNSLFSLDEDFYQFNTEAYHNQKEIINLNVSSVSYFDKSYHKFMQDLQKESLMNSSKELSKAIQKLGCFQQKTANKTLQKEEIEVNIKIPKNA